MGESGSGKSTLLNMIGLLDSTTEGNIEIELEDSTIELSEGEMFIVPKGAKHKPIARGEAHILLIEPRGVKNTGDIENELTAKNDIWI